MDVNIGETPAGRLKMELFSDIVPKYVPNLLLLIHFCSLQVGRQRTLGSYAQGNTGAHNDVCFISNQLTS